MAETAMAADDVEDDDVFFEVVGDDKPASQDNGFDLSRLINWPISSSIAAAMNSSAMKATAPLSRLSWPGAACHGAIS